MKNTLLLLALALASCSQNELREEIEPTPTPTPGCYCGEIVGRYWGEGGTRWFDIKSECTFEIKSIQVQPYYYELHGTPERVCLDPEEVVGELLPW
jgi:hypothetical protein